MDILREEARGADQRTIEQETATDIGMPTAAQKVALRAQFNPNMGSPLMRLTPSQQLEAAGQYITYLDAEPGSREEREAWLAYDALANRNAALEGQFQAERLARREAEHQAYLRRQWAQLPHYCERWERDGATMDADEISLRVSIIRRMYDSAPPEEQARYQSCLDSISAAANAEPAAPTAENRVEYQGPPQIRHPGQSLDLDDL